MLLDPLCYNLKIGGEGGFDLINRKGLAVQHITKENQAEIYKKAKAVIQYKLKNDDDYRKKWSNNSKQKMLGNQNWLGKEHSEETKQKMKISHKGQHNGTKNSQYGTMWITNGLINKKIDKTADIPDGFIKGRV
jgi:hypothetical protein